MSPFLLVFYDLIILSFHFELSFVFTSWRTERFFLTHDNISRKTLCYFCVDLTWWCNNLFWKYTVYYMLQKWRWRIFISHWYCCHRNTMVLLLGSLLSCPSPVKGEHNRLQNALRSEVLSAGKRKHIPIYTDHRS